MITLIIIFFILTLCASLSTNIWLSKWTDKVNKEILLNNTSSWSSQIHSMNIYAILGIIFGNYNGFR